MPAKHHMPRCIFFLITCLFSSCITLQAPQFKSISKLQPATLLSGNPRLDFNIQMYNPNTVSIALTDFNVDVKYGTLSLASLHLDTVQQVQVQSDFNVPLTFTPSSEQINNILQSGLGMLSSGSNSKLNGTGSVRVRKFIFSKTFRFSF